MPVPSFVSAVGGVTSPSVCAPGADLWATPGGTHGFSTWAYAGVCPVEGVYTCGMGLLPNGRTVTAHFNSFGATGADSGTCFQDTRVMGGGSGGGTGTGGGGGTGAGVVEATLDVGPLFNMTPEDGAIYAAAIASVWIAGAIWRWAREALASNDARGD